MRTVIAALFVVFAAAVLPSTVQAQAGLGRQKPPQQQDNKKQEEPQQQPQNKQQGSGKKEKGKDDKRV